MSNCNLFLLGIGLTGLTHLDLFGARITDSGTNFLRCMFHNFPLYSHLFIIFVTFSSFFFLVVFFSVLNMLRGERETGKTTWIC